LGCCFEIGADTLNSGRPRVASIAQIEDKPRISNDISSKAGGCRVIPAQEFFYFSEQIHLSFFLMVECDSAAHYLPTHFLLV